jgi:hypothetical protein
LFFYLFCSYKYHKTENYFIFELVKKKFVPIYKELKNYRLFKKKIVIKLSKIEGWDPESGIQKKPIPDPGSGVKKGTGSRIRIHNTVLKILVHVHVHCPYYPGPGPDPHGSVSFARSGSAKC